MRISTTPGTVPSIVVVEEYGGEDPYYSGYSARVTHLSNKIKQQRARSKDALRSDD